MILKLNWLSPMILVYNLSWPSPWLLQLVCCLICIHLIIAIFIDTCSNWKTLSRFFYIWQKCVPKISKKSVFLLLIKLFLETWERKFPKRCKILLFQHWLYHYEPTRMKYSKRFCDFLIYKSFKSVNKFLMTSLYSEIPTFLSSALKSTFSCIIPSWN